MWTVRPHCGPNHLGLWSNGISSTRMALITSGCGFDQTRRCTSSPTPTHGHASLRSIRNPLAVLSRAFACPFSCLSLSFCRPFAVLSLAFAVLSLACHCPFTVLLPSCHCVSLSFHSPFTASCTVPALICALCVHRSQCSNHLVHHSQCIVPPPSLHRPFTRSISTTRSPAGTPAMRFSTSRFWT